ncbi:MAG: hypothetical protein ACPGRX_06860 [Bdellovibrionales bacterium]
MAEINLQQAWQFVAAGSEYRPKAKYPHSVSNGDGTVTEIENARMDGARYVSGVVYGRYNEEGGVENATITTGTDGTEPIWSGKSLDDFFVTGDNETSKTDQYGNGNVDKMVVNGRDGNDTLILPGNKEDYEIVPAEIEDLAGNASSTDRYVVLKPVNPAPDGLQRIVIYNTENIVFTGDIDAPSELKTLADNRFKNIEKEADPDHQSELRNFKLITPDDVNEMVSKHKMEIITFDELYGTMRVTLTPDQRGAYDVTVDAKATFEARLDVINNLIHLKNSDDPADKTLYQERLKIATGQADTNVIAFGKGDVVIDPPLTDAELDMVKNNDEELDKDQISQLADIAMSIHVPDWMDNKIPTHRDEGTLSETNTAPMAVDPTTNNLGEAPRAAPAPIPNPNR